MNKKTQTAKMPDDLAGLLLRALEQDAAAIEELFGGRIAKTLGEVATAFQASPRTVQGWRSAGMPGSPGAFPLAAIFAWKLKRLVSAPQFTGSDAAATKSDLDRKRAADARKAEADAEKKELANAVARGNLLDAGEVDREWGKTITRARESLLCLPREMLPRFPRAVSQELSEELRRLIEGKLNLLAKFVMPWEKKVRPPAGDHAASE